MTTLELRVPPPVVALLTGLAMWGAAHGPPALPWPQGLRLLLALLLACSGVVFAVLGVLAFRRSKTTVNPTQPQRASCLVQGGIYGLSRNPMYAGLAQLLAAWAVQLGTLWPWAGPLLFVAYIQRFQIAPEERALTALFGAAYADYTRRVRRWL